MDKCIHSNTIVDVTIEYDENEKEWWLTTTTICANCNAFRGMIVEPEDNMIYETVHGKLPTFKLESEEINIS